MLDSLDKVELLVNGVVIEVDAVLVDRSRFKTFAINLAKGLYVKCSSKFHDWDGYEVSAELEQLIQEQIFYNAVALLRSNLNFVPKKTYT